MKRVPPAVAFRFAFGLVLLVGSLVGLSCETVDLGPIPSYEAAIGADAPRRFILFGDSRPKLAEEFWRPRYDEERLIVIRRLAEESPAFILNTGDLVAAGSDRANWRKFYDENQPIFSRKIPYFAAFGNHEYLWNPREGRANTFAVFPQLRGRTWYELRFSPVLVLVLDSNFAQLEEKEVAAQDRWLEETLAAAEGDSSVRHVLLAFHHAPYTNAISHGDSAAAQRHFLQRRTPKVRAAIAGHVHSYERFLKDGLWCIVSGGGGAPLFQLNLEHPHHKDLYRGPAYRPFHYCLFTVDADRLTCDVIMLKDGQWTRVDGFECK